MEFNPLMEEFSAFTMDNIKQQGIFYSFINVYSLSLLSGMGIEVDSKEDFLLNIQQQLNKAWDDDTHSYDFPYKLIPLKAVYGKGAPKLMGNNALEEENHLQWDKNTFKKTISPETQSLLIYNEIKLAKYLHHNSLMDEEKSSNRKEQYIGSLFIHMAKEQGIFCDQYLRDDDGSFFKKKEKSKTSNSFILKQKDTESELLDQVHMMTSFAHLFDVLSNPDDYPNYCDFEGAAYFHTRAGQLLEKILKDEDAILSQKTKNLVTVIPLFIETIDILHGSSAYENFVIRLCGELNARWLEDGKLGNERFSIKGSSFSTHSKALKALIKGYDRTNDSHLIAEAKKTYYHLNQYWNDSMDLFDYKGRKKIKYSAKDIGDLFGGLFSLYSLDHNEENRNLLTKQICSFFHSAINISGLQITPPILLEISSGFRSKELDALERSLLTNNTNSCVMLKDFKIYPKKNKIYIDVNKYNANYALHAAKEMLSMLDMDLQRE